MDREIKEDSYYDWILSVKNDQNEFEGHVCCFQKTKKDVENNLYRIEAFYTNSKKYIMIARVPSTEWFFVKHQKLIDLTVSIGDKF